ncbi:hypothetical protein SNE40_004344 [Patella caerulea]|uniref:Nucleoporin NUP42 n=2 Tax=Patella caerulea TaxID=87958 RepID=A0AAN8K2Q6_PATCE
MNTSLDRRSERGCGLQVMTEKPCKFYISGKKCKFGKHCRFIHSQVFDSNFTNLLNSDKNEILNTVTDSSNLLPSPLFNPSANSEQSNQDGAVNYYYNNQITREISESSQTGICEFYDRNGYCGYGTNCRYYHPESRDSKTGEKEQRRVKAETAKENKPEKNVIIDSGNGFINQDGIVEDSTSKDEKSEKQICTFFAKNGHCKFGKSCKYLHFYVQKKKAIKETEPRPTAKNEDTEAREGRIKSFVTRVTRERICPYFTSGYCRWGHRCRLFHPKDLMENVEDPVDGLLSLNDVHNSISNTVGMDEKKMEAVPTTNLKVSKVSRLLRLPVLPVKKVLLPKRSAASREELNGMRTTEIEQMKKRFPNDKLIIVEENNKNFVASFCFTPSDPDWPFDLKNFVLMVSITEEYPKEMLLVNMPTEQDMPETVRRYVQESVCDWLSEKSDTLKKTDKLELVFRPLLHWLDKNLESVVTNGLRQFKKELVAKAAGFEFIPASQLQSNVKHATPDSADDENGSDVINSQDDTDEDENESSEDEDKETKQTFADVERKGTEVSFKNLQLKEQSGTLIFEKINLSIQCIRCKTKSEFSTPCNRINSVDCTKCNTTQMARYRPAIAHQYSSVIGYLDLKNCTPFDLILPESSPVLSCMNCNNTTKISAFCSGQVHDINCRSCHEKLRVAVDAVRFFELQQAEIETANSGQIHKVGVKKANRITKNPAIQEGKPLPANGACKHYKKSYRWLRFPCCGKTYPCDICHNENETDHEMKYANRMICGYCCTEQIYSVEKPCKGCSQLMTKSAGCHWEGGQGCRDKIKMNRGDAQKYSNMGKTISKHAQKVKDMNSKKKTKLRHT